MDPLVIVFGLGVGVLVGLTGIGGGSLMTPLLLIVIGTQPHVAVGTDIAYGALTKAVGGWQHLRSGTVDFGVSKWLAFGSVPGSIGGVVLLWAAGLAHVVGGERRLRPDGEHPDRLDPRRAGGGAAGAQRARRRPGPALGCAMLGSALGVASKAGMDLPAWAIAGPPVLVGLFAYGLHIARARRRVGQPVIVEG